MILSNTIQSKINNITIEATFYTQLGKNEVLIIHSDKSLEIVSNDVFNDCNNFMTLLPL